MQGRLTLQLSSKHIIIARGAITIILSALIMPTLFIDYQTFAAAAHLPANAAHEVAAPVVYNNKINYPADCSDTPQTCLSTGIKNIGSFNIYRECWNFAYKKTCRYPLKWPQKDQCTYFTQCYLVGERECLLQDIQNQCVSRKVEFSCKRQVDISIEKEKLRTSLKAKDGIPQLICKGDIPCLDGNCFNKSFDINSEMMDSVSKLYALSQAKSNGMFGTKFFEGRHMNCTKKATDYSNCCKLGSDFEGWGHNLGAKCSSNEAELLKLRKDNKCVYVGKTGKGGISMSPVKHHYCCWNNLLNKVIQVEGRKQLYNKDHGNFGSGSNPDCRGLSINELLRLDFTKMDFSELIKEIAKQMKVPNIGDIDSRVRSSMPSMKQFDESRPERQHNKKAGVNQGKEGIMGSEVDYGQ